MFDSRGAPALLLHYASITQNQCRSTDKSTNTGGKGTSTETRYERFQVLLARNRLLSYQEQMNSVLPITYVSPFDFAKPEAFVRLEPEVCAFFQIFPEANQSKQTKPSQKEGQAKEVGDR